MNHIKLNKELNIKELSDIGNYDDKFHLPLTSKHALAVGTWSYGGINGVDLRRFSYDLSRLLNTGLTLTCNAWESLFQIIYKLHQNKCFTEYGRVSERVYNEKIEIDTISNIVTSVFDSDRKKYLSIAIQDANDQLVWRGFKIPASILILFNTIPDFISKCIDEGLVDRGKYISCDTRKAEIDRRTGKKIY